MFKYFFNTVLLSFIFLLIISIFIPFFSSIPVTLSEEYYLQYNINLSAISSSIFGFYWPLPYNHRISSSYHQGIDIPASENTYFLSIMDSKVVSTGFSGSGGYTIVCVSGSYRISYCHVSPKFLVSVGDSLVAGQVIGQVGPKYVYDVVGNPYHDATGRPTNGSTTGCHLHITIKLDGNAVNPLDYIEV